MGVNQQGAQITARFFEAIQALKARRTIKGKYDFYAENGLNTGNMHQIEKEPHRRALKPEHLAILVCRYHVSAHWLITGTGEMITI